jgi:hypothetical protein
MRKNKFALPIYVSILVLASLACTVFVGGPDYSDRTPVPVSKEAADGLKESIKRSFEEGLETGVVIISITEPQITSVLALRLQSDQNLQQDRQPIITEPQVYLRDGQMLIYGKTRQGMFTANIGIVVSVGVDENGKPKIEVTSADFGPLPVPGGLKDAISAMIEEAYTGSLGPVATGLRIESIAIADGVMTIIGRIR